MKTTLYFADYVTDFTDGMGLSTTSKMFFSPEERMNSLSKDYDKDEIDVEENEVGWQFYQRTINIEIVDGKPVLSDAI